MRRFYIFFIIIILIFGINFNVKSDDIYDLTRGGYTSFGSDDYSRSAADIDIDASGDISFGSSASCTNIEFNSNFDLGRFVQQMLNDITQIVEEDGKDFLQNKLVNTTVKELAGVLAKSQCSGKGPGSLLGEFLSQGGAEGLASLAETANDKLNEARAEELKAQGNNASFGQVTGSYAIKAFGAVINISQMLSSLAGSLLSDDGKKSEIEAKSYAECVRELTAYYTEWIVNMLNQKMKFDQDFQKYVRYSCELAAEEANSDLSSFLVRSAGVNPVHNVTPETALGLGEAKEKYTAEDREKIENEVIVFYDGVVVGNYERLLKESASSTQPTNSNDNTTYIDERTDRTYNDSINPSVNIMGNRATLPTAQENLNLIRSAFFKEVTLGNEENNITDYGFEKSVYSSSADPVLTMTFVLELYSIYDCYANYDNCFEDKGYPDTADFIINNYCVYNRTLFDLMANTLSRFANLTRIAQLSKQGTMSAEEVNAALIDDSTTLLQALISEIGTRIFEKVGIPSNLKNDFFNNDSVEVLVTKVIIPGFERYGAYADMMAFAKRFYSIDNNLSAEELQTVRPLEYSKYVPAGYLYSLMLKTGYPNLSGLRDYLNNNFSDYMITAISNYLAEKKSFELNQINSPAFEKRMADIFYYTQSNALKAIKIEMDNEYNSLYRRMQTRCTF